MIHQNCDMIVTDFIIELWTIECVLRRTLIFVHSYYLYVISSFVLHFIVNIFIHHGTNKCVVFIGLALDFILVYVDKQTAK